MGADYYATTIIGCKVTLQDLVIKKNNLIYPANVIKIIAILNIVQLVVIQINYMTKLHIYLNYGLIKIMIYQHT